MSDLTLLRDTLIRHRNPDGGWGYVTGQASQMEPTCLSFLALAADPARAERSRKEAEQFLADTRDPTGAFHPAAGRSEAIWPTALALFLQASLDLPADASRPTAARLLGSSGRTVDDTGASELHDIDLKLVGWPWADNNFSWTEPTSWACIALTRAGYGDHPRVVEGRKLLLDRAFDEGGINCGNRRVMGRLTLPVPGPTCLMLLALQEYPAHPRIDAAVAFLLREAVPRTNTDDLCWAKVALDCYRDKPGVADALAGLDEKIARAHEERGQTAWMRPSPPRVALTALALGVSQGSNPFRTRRAGETPGVGLPTPGSIPNGKPTRASGGDGEVQPVSPPAPGFGDRVRSFVRKLAVTALDQLKQPPAGNSQVHIARAADYQDDLTAILKRQYAAFRDKVPMAGKRVVLKPNFVEYHPGKPINTEPRVIESVIELCRAEGAAEVIVAEGPGHWRNVEYVVSASGLGDVLKKHAVPFVDLNHDQPTRLPNLGRLTGLDFLYMAKTVVDAEVLVSLPKLKTHHWVGVTLSLKNLFGTLPGICYGWPKNELHWRGIDQSIVDIALSRTPDLAVVDGVVGMDGDGPILGDPKPLGALIMGTDLPAVDATCCRLMRLAPDRVNYLKMAAAKKLGHIDAARIDQLGEPVAALATAFETLPLFHHLYDGREAEVAAGAG